MLLSLITDMRIFSLFGADCVFFRNIYKAGQYLQADDIDRSSSPINSKKTACWSYKLIQFLTLFSSNVMIHCFL